jgi:IS5 family transposase
LVFLIRSLIPGLYGYLKERMEKTKKDKIVWAELQRQLDAMGLQVSLTSVSESLDGVETLSVERFRMLPLSKRILVQQKSYVAMRPRPRRSKDSTWTKKGKKSYFGYKLHQKTDVDYCLIRENRDIHRKAA